jgi:hypothetical protein
LAIILTFGVWSLEFSLGAVIPGLLNNPTMVLGKIWRPGFFNVEKFKYHLKYGSKADAFRTFKWFSKHLRHCEVFAPAQVGFYNEQIHYR